MVATTVLAAVVLASAASAAPLAARQYQPYQPSYGNVQYESGFPVCQQKVEKPAYDNKGRGYGWENGKSCILPKGTSSYQPPSYQTPTYQAPAYQTPTYQTPTYQTPTYQTPTYQTPTYQTPTYQTPGYQAPSYEAPVYQQPPSYQRSSFASYFAPMMATGQEPAGQAPSFVTDPNYLNCESAKNYVNNVINSQNLRQCVAIACSSDPSYIRRDLTQCAQLEWEVKGTTGGTIPPGF
ncbi:hypothetical protein HK104_008122 [Borealophlyctis nickersoniae]|nr:hypothetical protein HK104_008122 [Borealophlyctis nickersoniae]